MLSRCLTSSFPKILNKNPRRFNRRWQVALRQFHSTHLNHGCKKKDSGFKMRKPDNCENGSTPMLEPTCKNAVVIGGSEGFGFAAADHLLCKGANSVIIIDEQPEKGLKAVRKLRDCYGSKCVHYLECDMSSDLRVESGLKSALCKVNEIHIIFNNVDRRRRTSKCGDSDESKDTTSSTIRVGTQFLRKDKGGDGGIIISCASIFGFMGWPEDPYPIYCNKEPVIQVTQNMVNEYNADQTGVRFVALCPANKSFTEIGLPILPDNLKKGAIDMPLCIPSAKYHIGTSLSYVMAWAKTGSAWLVEPAISVRQVPYLIHFPKTEGEKVDPRVYEAQGVTVELSQDGGKERSPRKQNSSKRRPKNK